LDQNSTQQTNQGFDLLAPAGGFVDLRVEVVVWAEEAESGFASFDRAISRSIFSIDSISRRSSTAYIKSFSSTREEHTPSTQ
jgi:hypothetical protein